MVNLEIHVNGNGIVVNWLDEIGDIYTFYGDLSHFPPQCSKHPAEMKKQWQGLRGFAEAETDTCLIKLKELQIILTATAYRKEDGEWWIIFTKRHNASKGC